MQSTNETIIALATPPGMGAISIVRLSGSIALKIANKIFSGADLQKVDGYTIHFGKIVDRNGEPVDEVLLSVFKNPNSYTGEDIVEISCHGSTYIAQEIITRCLELGAVTAQPGQFTMRAFLNGKIDLSQAEAVGDLISSRSKAAHKLAIQQMRGGYSNQIASLRKKLVHFASMLELELDFAEEDVKFADRGDLLTLLRSTKKLTSALIDSFRLGNAIKNGVTTVIAGRPNAGKSTLLNCLLNDDRAIVSDIPGTTRDTIEEILNINGIEFRLIDTAGIREARDEIEKLGVQKTLDKIDNASIVLYVFDVAKLDKNSLRDDLERLQRENTSILVVANKMDLNPYIKVEDFISQQISPEQFIPVSAKNDTNIGLIRDKLYEVVWGKGIEEESIIVSNIRHVEALEKTRLHLKKSEEGLLEGITSDFVAMDVRQAIYHLGEITGEITTDDLLDHIFGNFCIGK